MNRTAMLIAMAFALCTALIAAYWLGTRRAATTHIAAAAAAAQGKVLYWYDPMHPDQHFDKPGKSPFMDMPLLPKLAGEVAMPGVVGVDPAVVQNLGVRSEIVQVGRLAPVASVPATIGWDLRESYAVNARVDAIVERLYVRAPFAVVRTGQPLATLLAPEWSAAAAEYFALADAQSADGRALRAAAWQRLRALGLEDADIAALRPGDPRVTVRAPADGVVAELAVRAGERVAAGTPMLRINGLDRVWLEADVPQSETDGIAAGTPATATVSALPGTLFAGRVESLLPDVDAATRTQRVRIVLDNPGYRLAPGMFAQVRIAAAAGAAHPLVPDDALIATGDDTRVALAEGAGRFRVVRVRTGRSARGLTEVLDGLAGGEHVVVAGQFLIDSEASLSGALQRLDAGHAAHPAAAGTAGSMPPAPDAAHPAHPATGTTTPAAAQPAAPPGHASPDPRAGHGAPAEHRP